MAIDQIDDLLVDQPAQNHFHHVHGLAVGDAHTLDEVTLLADPAEKLANLRTAAMDHYGIDADQLHQHDVAREAALEPFVDHGVAAVLDHQRLAAETLDVRQGLR